ncbi:MAG: flagellar assembly protein FliX [Parvularculaceae bacterium]
MIRVSGAGAGSPVAGSRKTTKAGGGFRIDGGPRAAGATTSSAPAAPTETLSALIALQSDASDDRQSRAKTLVAAQRVLDLLDRLRMGLLDGSISIDDLNALATAAAARQPGAASDAGLNALYEDIALRARVELAKRGR